MMGGIRNASPNERIKALDAAIAALDRVAVAFSAGTDSTLLLARCLKVLGTDRVLAITADSPTLPRRELEEARALADELGARHMIIATHEMENLDFTGNSPDRCYHCKRELFERMQEVADAQGYACLAYGATADDTADHRPGMWAAREAGAVAPLLDAGLTKDDVRELSRRMGLRTWDKPAMACLSSRLLMARPSLRRRWRASRRARTFCATWAFVRCACAITIPWPDSRSRVTRSPDCWTVQYGAGWSLAFAIWAITM